MLDLPHVHDYAWSKNLSARNSEAECKPLVVNPKAAQKMLACGRTRLYELLAAGELETFKDGRSRKITISSIKAFVARRLAAAKREKLGG